MTHIKDENNECSPDTKGKPSSSRYTSLLQNPWWKRCIVLLPNLDSDKRDQEDKGGCKKCDYRGTIPSKLCSTPLKCEKQGDDAWDEGQSSIDVELGESLHNRQVLGIFMLEIRDHENNNSDSHSSKRQVDIEAPSPLTRLESVICSKKTGLGALVTYAHVISKSPSNEWTTNRCNAGDCAYQPSVEGPELERHCICTDNQSSRKYSRRSETGNDTANNHND